MYLFCYFFFCKQKTAYEMRISDWSSDVCSSDLPTRRRREPCRLRRARSTASCRGDPSSARSAPMRRRGSAGSSGNSVRGGSPSRRGNRSEERRVGKESVSTCRSRGSPHHEKKKHTNAQLYKCIAD